MLCFLRTSWPWGKQWVLGHIFSCLIFFCERQTSVATEQCFPEIASRTCQSHLQQPVLPAKSAPEQLLAQMKAKKDSEEPAALSPPPHRPASQRLLGRRDMSSRHTCWDHIYTDMCKWANVVWCIQQQRCSNAAAGAPTVPLQQGQQARWKAVSLTLAKALLSVLDIRGWTNELTIKQKMFWSYSL